MRKSKEKNCRHEYHETQLTKPGGFSGRKILFVCSKCKEKEYIGTKEANDMYHEQLINERFDIPNEVRIVPIIKQHEQERG